MREIKYQVFVDKGIIEGRPAHIYTALAIGFDEAGNLTKVCLEPCGWIDSKWVTLRQYTGLHDKNGKEIYEGDIVKVLQKIAPYPDAEDDECDTVELITKAEFSSGAFWLNGSGYSINNHFGYNNSDREVIGNIYENPELLKAEV